MKYTGKMDLSFLKKNTLKNNFMYFANPAG